MSFNRLPKRIAGPGFHVNVRYDDEVIARHRTSTNSAPLVSRATSDEVYDVKEMELLVRKKDSAMYYDGYTHCFSAVNGWENTQGLDTKALKQKILNDVDFVGVAVTEYKPSKAYSEQGFVSQIGGVVTLINEGQSMISPGQKVQLGLYLDNNRLITTDKGIPREKIRFCIEPADDDATLIAEAMKVMPQGGNSNTCIKGDIKTALDKLLTLKPKNRSAADLKALDTAIKANAANLQNLPDLFRAYRQVNQRVIGKALGSAKRGDRVEVLLQPRHAY
tara:strand:- start:130 stop:960 length:831 start_codon:yes stop_codon:yes gene_type:complete